MPEQHLAGLAAGVLLHTLWPRRLAQRPALTRTGGGIVLLAGATLAAWATRSAGASLLERPDRLITTGPYAYTRNPMYVGWTLGYVGTAALGNTAWPLILLPAVAAAVDREVRREERRLAERFPADFRAYARDVHRYAPPLWRGRAGRRRGSTAAHRPT